MNPLQLMVKNMSKIEFTGDEIIRSIYTELRAYQSNIAKNMAIYENSTWERFNSLIDRLSNHTGDVDYNVFKLFCKNDGYVTHVNYEQYQSKINGVIGKIEGVYGTISTNEIKSTNYQLINSQTQSQTQEIVMLLNFQSKLDSKLYDKSLNLTPKEKNFLEKIKSSISNIKDYSSLVLLILTHAKELGLTIEQIIKLLS